MIELVDQILEEAAQIWLRSNPYALDDYLDPELDENRQDWVRREQLPKLVNDLAGSFIRYAKDWQIGPEALSQQLDNLPVPLPLAQMGCAILLGLRSSAELSRGGRFRRSDPPGAASSPD